MNNNDKIYEGTEQFGSPEFRASNKNKADQHDCYQRCYRSE
jgi:hypothetical protein